MIKRGMSHIEFVVSFVIFIGFIVFAFVFFNPLQSQRTVKSTLDYAWLEISDISMEQIETYSVSIFPSFLLDSMQILIPDVPLGYNASVEDVDGNVILTHRDSTGRVYFNRGGKDFFKIKYSALIDNGLPISGTTPIGNNQYAISSSEVKEIYFEKLFLNLNQTYYSNYAGLKQEFNLPNRVDFGFVVNFEDYQINAVNEIPAGLEVLSKRDRVEIIRSSGKRDYAEVVVLVW